MRKTAHNSSVSFARFLLFFAAGPQAKYKQLLLSLGNVRNYRLVASVLAGNTTPVDLATKVRLTVTILAFKRIAYKAVPHSSYYHNMVFVSSSKNRTVSSIYEQGPRHHTV